MPEPLPAPRRGGVAKFTAAQAKEIRAKFWQGGGEDEVAAAYGTSKSTVIRIVEGDYTPRPDPN